MNEIKNENISNIIENSQKHINKTIYKYLFMLMKYIFIGKENFKNQTKKQDLVNKLNEFTEYINKNIIIKEKNFIKIQPDSERYSFKNFMNIINFIKSQNLVYAGNILEGILIFIFNYSCETSKEDNFGKFINKNFGKLRGLKNDDLPDWFKKSKDIFSIEEIQDIKKLLSNDLSIKDKPNKDQKEQPKQPIIHKLIFELMKNKYEILGKNDYNYINKVQIDKMKIYLLKYNSINKHSSNEQKDYKENSIAFLYNYFILKNECPIKIIYCFLLSVYIYNQNTLLLKLLNDPSLIGNPNVTDVKYTYQLKDYQVEGRFGNIITSPISIEPRIINIDFMQNNLRESGLFELGKILSFNKNIKTLNLKSCLIYDYYLDFFVKGFLFFDNDTLEELNLSKNRLKENSDFALSELIKHLKGLKTLNIFDNKELKGGLRHFFITLKTLYKKGKTKLENLNINKCALTDTSIYELGELLKSPYCGLKRLNIALNEKCYTINFLKILKFNRSLDELIIYDSKINDNDIDDICRIISNTNIRKINLFKNKFHIFGKTLRIIFRGKLVKYMEKKKKSKNEQNNIEIQKEIEKIDDETNKDTIDYPKRDDEQNDEESESEEEENEDEENEESEKEKKEKRKRKEKEKTEKIKLDLSKTIMHLDLDSNKFNVINHYYINLINNFIENYSTINCLDISHILYQNSSDINNPRCTTAYINKVSELKWILEKRKNYFDKLISYKVDIENAIKIYESKEDKQKIKDIDNEIEKYINSIIKNKLSIYYMYLKEKCYEIIEYILDNKNYYEKLIKDEQIDENSKSKKNDVFIDKLINYIKYIRNKEEIILINHELELKQLVII